MNLFRDMRGRILEVIRDLAAEGALPAGLETARVAVDPPREPTHGAMAPCVIAWLEWHWHWRRRH